MAEKDSNIDYELITKYLAGEASEEERHAIELWINISAANKHSFAQINTLWEQTGRVIPHEEADVDTERGWSQFQNRIKSKNGTLQDEEKPNATVRNLYFFFSRAAAVLLVGIVIYFIFIRESHTEEIRLVTIEKVKKDTLPDGSVTFLNTYSQLTFPKQFSEENRTVVLKGEAFFKVTSNPKKPFIVDVEGANISVLGTSFYVQAYDTLNSITVGVEEGSVKVMTTESEVVLKAGESITINRALKQITNIEPIDPNNLYWKSGILIFKNEKLTTVFETLEKKYNVSIDTDNKQILNCRLTAKFYGEDIEQIFDIINTNFNLTSTHEDDHFFISGNGCN